jgi:drug/metabolite transporter (DMT)-like permease
MINNSLLILAITGPAALIFVVVFILVAAFPLVFYLLTLQGLFREISIENRKMPPEQVWLSLIPIFGIIWQYVIVSRMTTSLRLEFDKRNIWTDEKKPGYNFGIAYCILFSASVIPIAGFLSAFGGLVCWVIYWVKLNEYKNLLLENPINYLNI